jgi:hypothetical protein
VHGPFYNQIACHHPRRYTKLYSHLLERYSTAAAEAAAAAGGASQRLPPPPELSLVHDCCIAQLLQPDMTSDAVQVRVMCLLLVLLGCVGTGGTMFWMLSVLVDQLHLGVVWTGAAVHETAALRTCCSPT